jgi:hypothetical protein
VLGSKRRVLGEEQLQTLETAHHLAIALSCQVKYVEAEEALQLVLAARLRVLGSAHPQTLAAADSLEDVRSAMRSERTKRGGKATARQERSVAPALSVNELAEAKARVAEAELLAMLELDEAARAGAGGSAKGKPGRGKRGKRS